MAARFGLGVAVVDDALQGITDVVRGEDLADNTPRQILLQRALGLPTPRYVRLSPGDDVEAAIDSLGLPVVVKPYDGNHGRGVFTNLNTREQVAKAWAVAADEGSGVARDHAARSARAVIASARSISSQPASGRGAPSLITWRNARPPGWPWNRPSRCRLMCLSATPRARCASM